MKEFTIRASDEDTLKFLTQQYPKLDIRENEYNGWVNRETWALSLHLNNTQELYNEMRAITTDKKLKDYEKEDKLKDFVEGLFNDVFETNQESCYFKDALLMVNDVGSLWRVDWKEIIKNNQEE